MKPNDSSEVIVAQLVETTPKVYSVPRRFGIGTLMGVAVVCALLIAAMQQLDAPPVVIIVNGIFLTLIGIMQAVMIKTPRWASILVGVVCFVGLFGWMVSESGWNGSLDGGLLCGFIAMVIGGVIYGYLGGTMVAGMFLVFDTITQYFAKCRQTRNDNHQIM